jgi:hypothetical protein
MTQTTKEHAATILSGRIERGAVEERRLVQLVAASIPRDRIWPPSGLVFDPQMDDMGGLTLSYRRPDGTSHEEDVRIHRHALNQLAKAVNFDMRTVGRWLDSTGTEELIWRRELLAHVLNTLYRKEKFVERGGRSPAFLHRIVGRELRGFLSRSYGRHLASKPMLDAFLASCNKVGARPVETVASDVRFSLKCFKNVVFDQVPGEYVAVGVSWANSDFGAGKMSVSLVLMRVASGTSVTLSDEISKVHLGSIIEESDIELSDETAAKEVEAQASAINDTVTQLLSDAYVARLLSAMEAAHREEIPWHKLKGQLKDVLKSKEDLAKVEALLDAGSMVDLPPIGTGKDGKPLPTRWWASSVVSMLAGQAADEERKFELQRQAGVLLDAVMPEPA